MYSVQKQLRKAEPYFLEALQIAEKCYGKNDRHVARYLKTLADLYYNLGEIGKAEEYHKRMNAILLKK